MEDLDVLELLGQGGFASVYLCREKQSQQLVAVKRIPCHRLEKPEQRRRAAAERFVLEHVRHPFLGRGVRTIDDADFHSFVMEYIEDARPLYQCIWRYRSTGRFPEPVAKFYAAQIALAVAELHRAGFVHRDLKSGNVLIDKHGRARVIDFGFARKMEQQQDEDRASERALSICGTQYIMAPEMFLRQPYARQIDWWGLGVIVHEMVCGRPPWAYKPLDAQMSSIERFFDSVSATAKGFAAGQDGPAGLAEADVSDDCKAFIRQLLSFNPRNRLGHGGVDEVMAHAWFRDIDWPLLRDIESRGEEITLPYDPIADFNADMASPPAISLIEQAAAHEVASSSSADSIDPNDNATLFADF